MTVLSFLKLFKGCTWFRRTSLFLNKLFKALVYTPETNKILYVSYGCDLVSQSCLTLAT